jgi:uncharacterized coiled-coil protein SlyX
MRRRASEIIRDLEIRVAHLENEHDSVDEIFEQIVNDRNVFDTLQRKKEHLSKIMSRGRYDKSRALKAMFNVVENYLLFHQTKKRFSKVTKMKVAEKLLETSIKDINRLGEDLFDQSFSKRNFKEASEIRIARLENKTASVKPTIKGFLLILQGSATQYDERQMRKSRFWNANALSHYMDAVSRIEEKFSVSDLKSSDPALLRVLIREIDGMFLIPGIKNKVIKAINQYIDNGKLPKYPGSSKRKASLEKSSIEMWHGGSNFKFNTIYWSRTLSVNFYPLRKLKSGKIQGVQMDFRGKPRLMSHLDSDFDFLGMREDTEISSKDEKKILDYVSSRTASIK